MALPILYGNGSTAFPTVDVWAGSWTGTPGTALNSHLTSSYHDSVSARCGGAGGHSGNDSDPFDNAWYKFTLPEAISVDRIDVQWRSTEYIDPVAVFVSSDGSSWTKVGTWTDGSGGVESYTFTQEDDVQYIAISDQYASGYLTTRLYWIDIYGERYFANAHDLSTATLDSSAGTTDAEGGVTSISVLYDSDRTVSFSPGIISSGDQWIEVDFGTPQSVETVIIDQNNSFRYADAISIYYGSNGVDWTLAQAFTSLSYGELDLTLSSPQTARYWKIQEESASPTQYWRVYEVRMIAEAGGGGGPKFWNDGVQLPGQVLQT